MPSLLYMQVSPRGDRSVSIAVADAFVETWHAEHPGAAVETINLFECGLPPFATEAVQGKYAILYGKDADKAAKDAFEKAVPWIERFRAADVVVLAVPMWNFGIPYVLKQYFDLIVQPTYTFNVGENGYEGLCGKTKVFLALARGGDYLGKDEIDFQERYLRHILSFIGVADVKSVVVQPTLAGDPDAADGRKREAMEKARGAAKQF